MNYAQFGLFIIYGFSILISGVFIYNFIDRNNPSFMNRSIYLGEVLLIGAVLLTGQLLILSLVGLYKAAFLWAMVLINYLFLLNKDTRNRIHDLFTKKISFSLPCLIFIILIFIFIFRNCYFMVDVDSHSTYLFAQRLWLSGGTRAACSSAIR